MTSKETFKQIFVEYWKKNEKREKEVCAGGRPYSAYFCSNCQIYTLYLRSCFVCETIVEADPTPITRTFYSFLRYHQCEQYRKQKLLQCHTKKMLAKQ